MKTLLVAAVIAQTTPVHDGDAASYGELDCVALAAHEVKLAANDERTVCNRERAFRSANIARACKAEPRDGAELTAVRKAMESKGCIAPWGDK